MMNGAAARVLTGLKNGRLGRVDPSRDLRPIWLSLLIFCPLSILAAIKSDGFLEADGITHYLYARFAFSEPHYFVNIWGRPICTAVYALPAYFGGLVAVRIASLALAVLLAALAYAIARRQHFRRPSLAFIFTFAQPLVFLHSWSELTELPFTVLLAAAFLAYCARRWWLLAVFAGLLPLSRPEGFGFILLAAAALVLHRRAAWLFILPVPLLLWNLAGWLAYGRAGEWWRWLPNHWPYAGDSLYPSGSILHFVALMPVVTSPLIFPATCAGAAVLLRTWRRTFGDDDRVRCDVLIAAIPLLILVGHSVLYATGKMASSGELRYMLVVAPFWALLSARGWEWFFRRFDWAGIFRWAGIVSLFPIAVNLYYRVVPRTNANDTEWQRATRIVSWYAGSGVRGAYPRIVASHPGIFYMMDVSMTDGRRVVEWHRDKLLDPPAGAILIWDPVFSLYNADRQRSITEAELRAAGWTDQGLDLPGRLGNWHVLRSPRAAHGQ